MTLEEIKALVLTADNTAEHYESSHTSEPAYTVWREYRRLPATADDRHIEGWVFQVDRYTQDEYDETAAALFDALDGSDRVAVHYEVDHEPETGYIHHIFECEGL